jgi:molybdenum transport protein
VTDAVVAAVADPGRLRKTTECFHPLAICISIYDETVRRRRAAGCSTSLMGGRAAMDMLRISDEELRRWLAEDVPYGDLTTQALGIGRRNGRIRFAARRPMVVACADEAARIMEMAGARVTDMAVSGARVPADAVLVAAEGPAYALHAGWKVAQVLLESAGGIATAARAIVDAVRGAGSQAMVACTRKSPPGTRSLAVKAALCGGAVPHRLGLSETILLFAQHRAFCGDETLAVMIERLRRHAPEKKIVVEADTYDDACAVADAGADVVQIDKASAGVVARVRGAFDGRSPRPLLAAAGGINAANAADYADAGADVIVTSAPYTAPPIDVKVTMQAD